MNDAFGRPQRVLLVGATSDIGAQVVDQFLDTIDKLALASRNEVELSNGDIRWFCFDAENAAAHEGMVEEVCNWLGDIDLAIIAHGDLGPPFSLEQAPKDVARLLNVNAAGAASVTQAVAKQLVRQGHGNIVALSSVAAIRPRLANLAYASGKAGFDAFCVGLQQALENTGVDLMIVRPGFVRSKMTAHLSEQPFAVEPSEVAKAVVDGLASKKSVVYAPGKLAAMPVMRLVPKRLWRRISTR